MNREQQAIELVVRMAKLIVGHPQELKHRTKDFAGNMILILEAISTDVGRLIGPKGAIHQAMQRIGSDLSLKDFELVIGEPVKTGPIVAHKPWVKAEAKAVLSEVAQLAFTNSAEIVWSSDGELELAEIRIGSGFDQRHEQRMAEDLKLVFHSIGRAHARNVKVWLAEKVSA